MDTPVYTQEQLDTIVAEALRRQRETAQVWQERIAAVKHWHEDLIEHQKALRLLFDALNTAMEDHKQVVEVCEEQRLKLEEQFTTLQRWSALSGTPRAPWPRPLEEGL
jgi:hypothetical protein